MAYHVYILKSTNNRHYIGYTSNLEKRIYQHNNKHHGFTNSITEVWALMICREYPTKKEAMEVETKLKSFKNYQRAIRYLEKAAQG